MKRGIEGPKLHLSLVVRYYFIICWIISLKKFHYQFVSYFVEPSDDFVQRVIVSISHDMRDQQFLEFAVLDQLKKMEMRLVRKQDQEEEDEFFLNISLKTMGEFNYFDEDLIRRT